MKSLLFATVFFLLTPLGSAHTTNDWRFCGAKQGVWFSWQLDDSWNMLYIKAKNKNPSTVDYEYELLVYDGENLIHQETCRYTRLKSKDEYKFKVGRRFNYVSHVVLKKLKIQRGE